MAANLNSSESITSSFSDLPEDVQFCILSFLDKSELSAFACTSKRFCSLCRDDAGLWFSLCDRRWGSKTLIKKWGNGKISFKLLYNTLLEYENLIGFWRRSGTEAQRPSPLLFFEWGPSFITGSRVSPSKEGTWAVIKSPFLWITLTSKGEPANFLDPDGKLEFPENLVDSVETGNLENELVPVNLSFMGKCHFVLEENVNSNEAIAIGKVNSGNMRGEEYEEVSISPGSLPDRLMSEIYQYFANRTSPGGNGSSRRQRRRGKERQTRRKLVPEHYVKIVNCSPIPARPLQGLWKGVSVDRNLEFYLISYDDIGGIACRRVGDSSVPSGGYTPVFWTSSTTWIEPPFPEYEEYQYYSRIHLRPPAEADKNHEHPPLRDLGALSRILPMTSSYDVVIPGTAAHPVRVQGRIWQEGRIWQYENGTIGFGFLRNSYTIDLRHISEDGHLLDAIDLLK